MNRNEHIIDETILNFKVFGAENPLSFPDQLEDWFFNIAVDGISDVCDTFTTSGEYIEIDVLEIDLGKLKFSAIDEAMSGILKEKLRRGIKDMLSIQSQKNIEKKARTFIEAHRLIQAFIYFIAHGRLPWEVAHWRIHDLEKALLKDTYSLQHSLSQRLLPLLHKEVVRKRLAFNFSSNFTRTVASGMLKIYRDNSSDIVFSIAKLKSIGEKQEQWKILADWFHKRSARNSSTPTASQAKGAKMTEEVFPVQKKEAARTAENTIYVSDAGVVLMHPFLTALFKGTALIVDGVFLSERHREKAIWMMYFMVHGHLDFDESELSLLKLLCGKPIEEALTFYPQLSVTEKEEVEHVLKSAIKHWSALKNTGIASFRNTFLKREGRIFLKENQIEIDVQQQTVDILLNQLPWSVSYISLPWVAQKIKVNWA